jgi:hypothetical protein
MQLPPAKPEPEKTASMIWSPLKVKGCPLQFSSNNAPALNDLLGTITLAILAGQNRYAHVTTLRADTVNP